MDSDRIVVTNPDFQKGSTCAFTKRIRIRQIFLKLAGFVLNDLNQTSFTIPILTKLLKSGFVTHKPKQIFLSPDLWSPVRNKSMDS
jgi:hypothetical protein